jgi:hypothetical protein
MVDFQIITWVWHFKAKNHFAFSFIISIFAVPILLIMVIEFCHLGAHLTSRYSAATVRERIVSSFRETDKFIFDFQGVEFISNAFADECFAELICNFEMEDIQNKSTFQNASPSIKATVANAFKDKISQLTLAE